MSTPVDKFSHLLQITHPYRVVSDCMKQSGTAEAAALAFSVILQWSHRQWTGHILQTQNPRPISLSLLTEWLSLHGKSREPETQKVCCTRYPDMTQTKLFTIALYAQKKYSCYFIYITLFESCMMQ